MRPSFRWAYFMRHPDRDVRLEKWEQRENSVVSALPYAMLAFVTVLTVVLRQAQHQSWLIDLGLCALTAVWMLWLYTLHPAWQTRGRVIGLFFAGLVILMGALVFRDPWFGFFTFTGYFYALKLPVAWGRAAGVAAIATLTGTSQAGGVPRQGGITLLVWAACVVVNLAVAGAFTWFGWVMNTQNDRRKTLVEELSTANKRLEATLAENAGLHQQLLTQAREAGILDERQRMAREIHDTLAQGLTGIITQLQAAEQASDDRVARRRHFDAATQLARDSLSEARRSVDALRPEPLEQARLSDALAAVAERWSALHGVDVQVTVTGTAHPMAADTEFALLRTAQEALANVARHAAASRVGLTLSYMEEEVALDVRDDGRGFDATRVAERGGQGFVPAAAAAAPAPATGTAPATTAPGGDGGVPSGGFGLVAMRERIEALSGTLEVESEPGAGTAVSACVPFRPAEAPGSSGSSASSASAAEASVEASVEASQARGPAADVPGPPADVPAELTGARR